MQSPIKDSFIESIIKRNNDSSSSPVLERLANELCTLFVNQPDYVTFLEEMDGFEYDGITLFSLSIPEPVIKNLFVVNEYYRNNDDYIDPDLAQRLVIGESSTSLFTYDTTTNLFEIRDSASTESIYGTFESFTNFLSKILITIN
ncbi:YrhA family protein [Serratia marcescens]|uniref:YrhA family protein n=1 Tax=Serratia marcescens TaxID=615 RepID=UPI0011E84C51|nr:YrhA family protein [Serratia marcescens]